jgi:aryl-alcohol dehydrogenase-like predicted oxidoreductase
MDGLPDLKQQIPLGRTGKMVGRLGIASSYGISKKACLEAFDAGVNYFFWGSTRTAGMALAIRDLAPGRRGELCVVLQVYGRRAATISKSIRKGLEALGLEYADVLLLGWHEKAPHRRILEAVAREKEKGTFRYLGISSHQRPLFREFLKEGLYDVFHVRYNAAHVGAEGDLFPHLPEPADGLPPRNGPGIVAFTVLRWGDLLNPKKMPSGQAPLSAADCYRFAMSNPHIHVTITGPTSDEEVRHALRGLEAGPLDAEAMARVRAVGDHVYRQKSVADWFR